MDVQSISNFLVENGEFVEQELVKQLETLSSVNDRISQRKQIAHFFETNFPHLNTTSFFAQFFPEIKNEGRLSILKSYEKLPTKRSVQDFVKHFNVRFKELEKMLKSRTELSGLASISRIKGRTEKERVSIIGMVLDKRTTKNGHIILNIEDLSGTINVLVNKDNKELLAIANDLVFDETIGIVGVTGGDIIFSESIIFPDIPLSHELKKSPLDNYAVFIGDIHFASKDFLDKEFRKLILWLNGKVGTLDQRKIARKVKYLFLVGDVIEGVSVYPGQEDNLIIKDVEGQYNLAAKYLKLIPPQIKIVICPGNHDVGRLAEPQLPIDKEYAQSLWDLPNVIMVSNPAYLAIDVTKDFPGLTVLMHHGYSLIYYSDMVSSIRANGGQKCVDDIMVYLLKKRHLAPTHGSTMYIPDPYEDSLLIDPIPDIFVTGHIHRAQSKSYRNVTCINSSGWVAITEDQEKRGLEPQPGRAFIVSLKTREVKIMNFNDSKDASSVAELKRNRREEEKINKNK